MDFLKELNVTQIGCPASRIMQVNGAVLLLGNVIVVASPLLGYRLASYTWLIWMGCLVPFLVGYALSKVLIASSEQNAMQTDRSISIRTDA